ncbi:hypothetical protein CGRA01v4_04279 [Colletotrichum graminicola]|nr:hypothetical protein CGRA01v4_04279 [Colletotrichum graminicola]
MLVLARTPPAPASSAPVAMAIRCGIFSLQVPKLPNVRSRLAPIDLQHILRTFWQAIEIIMFLTT